MFYHIIRFAMRDGLSGTDAKEVSRRILSLAELDSVSDCTVCQDVGNPDDGFTHSAIITFPSLSHYITYLTDPEHATVIDFVLPKWKKMLFCDASEEFDPSMYTQIQDAVTKMGGSPELIEHIQKINATVVA